MLNVGQEGKHDWQESNSLRKIIYANWTKLEKDEVSKHEKAKHHTNLIINEIAVTHDPTQMNFSPRNL